MNSGDLEPNWLRVLLKYLPFPRLLRRPRRNQKPQISDPLVSSGYDMILESD